MSNGPFVARCFADKKTEIYRTYLEEHGVLKAFSAAVDKLLKMPINERPTNPVRFVAEAMYPDIGNHPTPNLPPASKLDDLYRTLRRMETQVVNMEAQRTSLSCKNDEVDNFNSVST